MIDTNTNAQAAVLINLDLLNYTDVIHWLYSKDNFTLDRHMT